MKLSDIRPWRMVPRYHRAGKKLYKRDIEGFIQDARERMAIDDETITIPTDCFRLLVDLASGNAVIKEGRPEDHSARMRRWMFNSNVDAARYAERLKHVWRVRYGETKGVSEKAIEKAVAACGGEKDKVRNILHTGRHKKPPKVNKQLR